MKKVEKEVKAKPKSFKVPVKSKKSIVKVVKVSPPPVKKKKIIEEHWEEERYEKELTIEDEISNELERVLDFEENKKIYALIVRSYNYAVISKRLRLEVKMVNNNSIMQPYENSKERDIWCTAIVKWGFEDDDILESLASINCPIHKVRYVENVKSVLDAVGRE